MAVGLPVVLAIPPMAGWTQQDEPSEGEESPSEEPPPPSADGPSGPGAQETPPEETPPEETTPAPGEEASPETGVAPVDSERPVAYFEDGNVLKVTEFELEYTDPTSDQLSLQEVFDNIGVRLLRTDTGWVAPRPGMPGETLRIADVPELEQQWFYNSAIRVITEAVLEEFARRKQVVIIVVVDEDDVDQDGYSIRPPDRTALRLKVWTGRVAQIRTLASGNRFPPEKRPNNPAHSRIREHSPISEGGLIFRNEIEEYIFRLNRHPGRRVDVALSESEKEGGVVLDYLVYENKPWFVYTEVSNTGTEPTTEWRERFGFVNNQLTDHDDIFNVQYVTGDFDEVHAFVGSYEAPIFGTERWRWQVLGNWSRFDASEVGIFDEDFSGDQWTAGGQLLWNVFQHRDFFLDLFAGFRWQNIEVDTESTGIVGDDDFFLPRFGLKVEQLTETYRTKGSLDVEFNVADISGTDAPTLDQLGRINAEDDFQVMHWAISHSHFLDPYIFGEKWEDPNYRWARLAHEVVATVDGQTAFGDRLTPQFQRISGGLYTVRGYPESITAGDTTFNFRLDYQLHVPQLLPRSDTPPEVFGRPFRVMPQQAYGRADWDLILRTFVDVGQVINADRENFEKDETLLGTGVGLELLLKQNFSFRMDWGIALTDVDAAGNPVNNGDNRFHFVFTLLF